MENTIIITLSICLLSCFVYIYLLHSGYMPRITFVNNKQLNPKKNIMDKKEEDNMSFLDSNSDTNMSMRTADIFDDDQND